MLRIKELREQRGLSQASLASSLGVAQNTLSNWENAKRAPDSEKLIRIADYFAVSVDYLLGRAVSPSHGNEKTAAMVSGGGDYSDLTPEAKTALNDYVDFLREKYK